MTEYIFPKIIKDSFNAESCHNLIKKQPMQIGLAERSTMAASDGSYIILDYGKEMNGGIRILTFLAENVNLVPK